MSPVDCKILFIYSNVVLCTLWASALIICCLQYMQAATGGSLPPTPKRDFEVDQFKASFSGFAVFAKID